MADDEDITPQAGELVTANYGWIKPTVGDSDDAWGGYINSDLDGIDTTVKSVSTVANAAYPATNPGGYQTAAQVTAAVPVVTTTTPAMDGTAAIGSTGKWADGGHVHPTDTSRYAASNPSNFITAATLPIASTTVLGGVKVDGTTISATGAGVISTTVVPLGDNRIINGNFAVNQRGYVSGTALAAAAYGHDRWKAGASGCTYTFTAALPDTTITITAGTLTQIIEAGMIEGGVYTLSWTGTAQARVYQGAPTGAYAASPIATAALPAGVNTIVEFNTGTVTRVKLEIGTVATPYNRQSLAKSQADCERYFRWLPFNLNFVATVASQVLAVPVNFPAMRTTPVMAAPVADPSLSQQIANAGANNITGQTPGGGYAILTAGAAGAAYMIGYRCSAYAEL